MDCTPNNTRPVLNDDHLPATPAERLEAFDVLVHCHWGALPNEQRLTAFASYCSIVN